MKVFYDERQSVKENDSFSPSAQKPAKVLESWRRSGTPFEECSFAPLTPEEMANAHDRGYVDGVLACTRRNGFGNNNPQVAKALPWICGSMVAAALHAFKTGETSFSPTSGAHHAGYAHGGGYCTFNFLAMAAIKAHAAGAKKVGIVDLDCHYGDGTQDIIERLGLSYVVHYTFGGHDVRLGASAERWLSGLGRDLRRFEGVDLIIYNAGVDSHIDDPLGGILTTGQMARRDHIVFSAARDMGIPVCVSLAGGYQKNALGDISSVLRLHDTTFGAAWGILENSLERAA